MKKTYNINISGYGFVIDEDAYEILNSYLSTLGEICNKANQPETASDIEQRIAEIFSEKFSGREVFIISKEDVEEVIGRMGSPEEIVEIEVESTTPPPPPFSAPIEKRLYRDTSNKVIGGVCSGLGWYLGVDPVWVRIIAVALAFLSGSTLVLIYVILWIIIPPAKSPYERMQMMGVSPSMSNVGKVVTGEFNQPGTNPRRYAQPSPSSSVPEATNGIGRVTMMILSIIALLIVGSLLLALSLAFVGCVLALCITPAVRSGGNMAEARLIMGCVAGGSLVVGLPLFMLFRTLISSLTGKPNQPFSVPQWVFMLIFWVLGIAACITCGCLL